jgi:hypothetical protein
LNGVAEEVRTSGVGVQGGSTGLEQSQKLTLNPASLAIRKLGHLCTIIMKHVTSKATSFGIILFFQDEKPCYGNNTGDPENIK